MGKYCSIFTVLNSCQSVSHLKMDDVVVADFLLGVDMTRNNEQCRENSANAQAGTN